MSDTYIGNEVGNYVALPSAGFGYTKLYGIGGDDQLATSINGAVYLEGGEGNDYLLIAWGGGSHGKFYGGDGNDRIQGGGTGSDTIYGGDGDDFVEQNPGTTGVGDLIYGGGGRDALRGEKGGDRIYGGDGDDSGAPITAGGTYASTSTSPGLFGGRANDTLDGGAGNDLLDGGPGKDIYVGGLGKDKFAFGAAADSKPGETDTIEDFRKGDKIDVSAIDAKKGGGDNKFKFIGKDGFHDKAGELRFKKGLLQGDVNGDGKADFQVHVAHVSGLKDGDFVL